MDLETTTQKPLLGGSASPASERAAVHWADAPIVFVVAPTCPECGSAKYERKRTEDGGDGSRTKKVICLTCRSPYKICVELPESGKCEVDT